MDERGPGDIEFWIEPPMLLSIYADTHEIIKRIRASEVVKTAEELREFLNKQGLIRRIPERDVKFDCYAIDSSYAMPPLELTGGVLTVLSYGYVGFIGGKYDRYVRGEVVLEDTVDFEKAISRRAQIVERKLAIRLLRDKACGRRKFDILVLDGEIPIHPLPYNLPVEGGVLEEGAYVVNDLLRLAEETGTILTGVVKRVRSRYLSVFRGSCTPANDKLLMSLILRQGEYVDIGTFRDLLPKWIEVNYSDCELRRRCKEGKDCKAIIERMRRRLEEGLKNVDRVLNSPPERLKWISKLGDIHVVFYKPRECRTAVKLEVYIPEKSTFTIEDVISFLEARTGSTGYPFLLDRVDEYVRVDSRILDYVRSLILKEVREWEEVYDLFLQLTNPQKAYLYRRLEG